MKTLGIDRLKHLSDEPKTGHNRWHPDIPPILEVGEGVDLRISNVVDVPNVVVSALLSEDILQG